jgi:hypothetical protein
LVLSPPIPLALPLHCIVRSVLYIPTYILGVRMYVHTCIKVRLCRVNVATQVFEQPVTSEEATKA